MFSIERLHDRPLVIDGNSFLHQIYFSNKIKCEFNGNYDELKQKLKCFFGVLKRCNIEPYVLLDGARDVNNEKFQTVLERTKDRIQKFTIKTSDMALLEDVKSSSKMQEQFFVSKYILPLNANLVLHEVLVDLKIKCFQCKFEADYCIAYLANRLNAPVLSLDSDFYVFDLNAGYIAYDSLDLDLHAIDAIDNSRVYLNAKLYKRENFLNQFDLNTSQKKSLLYVFVVLCGNDFINQKEFLNLKQTLINENNNSKSLFHSREQRINFFKKLLGWLSRFQTLADCVLTVLKFLDKNSHEYFQKCVDESMRLYSLADVSKDKFEMDCIFEFFNVRGNSTQKSDFLKKYSNGYLSSLSLNVLLNRSVFVLSQLEIKICTPTGLSSMSVRHGLYTMLFNYFKLNRAVILNEFLSDSMDIVKRLEMLAVDDHTSTPIVVNEYSRHKNNIKIYEILITAEDLNLFAFDFLKDIKNKFSILNKLLGLNENQIAKLYASTALNDEMKTYFLILYFCYAQNHPDDGILKCVKNLNFIRVFLVALNFEMIERSYGKESHDGFDSKIFTENFDLNVFLRSKEWKVKNIGFLKDTFIKLSSFKTKALKYNFKFIHCLGEYQAVYQALFHFNRFFSFLFGFDLLNFVRLDEFFNGSFLHNFYAELQSRDNPGLYVEELLGRKSLLRCVYMGLFEEFVKIFDIDMTTENILANKQNKRSGKKSRKAKTMLVETDNRFFLLDQD